MILGRFSDFSAFFHEQIPTWSHFSTILKTHTWGKRYPILLQYQGTVNVERYTAKLELMLEELKRDYGYNELDTFLVLKDILAQVWYRRKKLQKEAGRP